MQRQPSVVQSTRGASAADAEATRADAGPPGADAVQIGQTLGLQEQFYVEELLEGFSGVSTRRFPSKCEV